jgi:hypothetical protein
MQRRLPEIFINWAEHSGPEAEGQSGDDATRRNFFHVVSYTNLRGY